MVEAWLILLALALETLVLFLVYWWLCRLSRRMDLHWKAMRGLLDYIRELELTAREEKYGKRVKGK